MHPRIWLAIISIQGVLFSFLIGVVVARPGSAAAEPSQPTRMETVASTLALPVWVANAQTPTQPIQSANLGISLAEARVIVDAAVAYGRSVNGAAGIAVVDGGGNTVSLDRMDGASYQQDRQAAGKARIAVMLRNRTSVTAGLIETAPDRYFSTLSMFPGEVFWQTGGVPLVVDGRIVGGVGISGFVSGGDDLAADAAIEAWQQYREGLPR